MGYHGATMRHTNGTITTLVRPLKSLCYCLLLSPFIHMDTSVTCWTKKGIADDERDFLKTAEENFTSYYPQLIP